MACIFSRKLCLRRGRGYDFILGCAENTALIDLFNKIDTKKSLPPSINFIPPNTMQIKVLLLSLFFCFSFSVEHDYYLSTTKVRWVPQKQQLQLTSRFFLEDIEALMQEQLMQKFSLPPIPTKQLSMLLLKNFTERILR